MARTTLRDLLEDRLEPETARLHERLEVAVQRMLEHDYSQLPVVEDHAEGGLHAVGLVTMTSAARATLHLGEPLAALRVEHALEHRRHEARSTDELLATLNSDLSVGVLLVRDEKNRLAGLLTDADFAMFLRVGSQDLLLTADVEASVKQLIQRAYTDDPEALKADVIAQELGVQRSSMGKVRRVVDACLRAHSQNPERLSQRLFKEVFDEHVLGKGRGDFDRLSFAQFNGLFLGQRCWAYYEARLGLPKEALLRLLDQARELRNRLAHHRGELDATERDRLLYLRDLLDRVLENESAQEAEAPGLEDSLQQAESDVEDPESDVDSGEYDQGDEEDEDPGRDAVQRLLKAIPKRLDRVKLSFSELDERMPDGLPAVARQHRSWWSNDPEAPHARAWLDIAWRVVSVNMGAEQVTFARNTEREKAYIEAFGKLFHALERSGEWSGDWKSPAGRSFQHIAHLPEDGRSTAGLVLSFASGDRFRVELYIDSRDRARNKAILDALFDQAHELSHAIEGHEITWERLNNRRASRVAVYYPEPVHCYSSDEELDALAGWVAAVTPPFHAALRERYRDDIIADKPSEDLVTVGPTEDQPAQD